MGSNQTGQRFLHSYTCDDSSDFSSVDASDSDSDSVHCAIRFLVAQFSVRVGLFAFGFHVLLHLTLIRYYLTTIFFKIPGK